MKILYSFIGSICSGKSTIAENISKKLGVELFSIDQFRIKHNAFLISEEWSAWDDLNNCISIKEIAIIESSGLSRNVREIYNQFDKVVVIKLICSNEILINRLKERKLNNYPIIPYYLKREESDEHTIIKMNEKINSISADYVYDTSKLSINEIVNDLSLKL